jgi:VanZ family protein
MSLFRLFPAIGVMGIIFSLSGVPGDSIPLPDIVNLDKVLHAGVYGILAVTVLFALPEQKYLSHPWKMSLLVVLFCLLYGISDEFHQSFIPNRCPSVFDLIADTGGGAVAVLIWFRFVISGAA